MHCPGARTLRTVAARVRNQKIQTNQRNQTIKRMPRGGKRAGAGRKPIAVKSMAEKAANAIARKSASQRPSKSKETPPQTSAKSKLTPTANDVSARHRRAEEPGAGSPRCRLFAQHGQACPPQGDIAHQGSAFLVEKLDQWGLNRNETGFALAQLWLSDKAGYQRLHLEAERSGEALAHR